jgi:hypothetical protein
MAGLGAEAQQPRCAAAVGPAPRGLVDDAGRHELLDTAGDHASPERHQLYELRAARRAVVAKHVQDGDERG